MKKNDYEIGQVKHQSVPRGGPPGGPGGGMRMGAVEKPKDFKSAWRKLFVFGKAYLPALLAAVAAAVAGSVAMLSGPERLRRITNLITDAFERLASGGGWSLELDKIAAIAVTLVVLYIVGALLIFTQGWTMATVTQKLTKSLRREISGKINRLPLRYFDRNTYGSILSRVTNDIDTLSQTLNQSLGLLVTSVTMILGASFLMLITNVVMAATALVTALLGFVGMMFIVRSTQKYFVRNQKYLSEINGHVEEIYAGHNVVRAYNGEKAAVAEFRRINAQLYDANWKSQFFSGLMMPLMHFVGNLSYVAVCVVGALLAKNGMSFGVIVAFIVYVRMFTQPLSQVAQAMTNLQSAAAASERVFEFLEEEELEDESHKTETLTDVRGDVTFDRVSFGYTPDKTVINNFSADIRAGQKVAIVGPTGAGKTTIVNLLMRFYEIDSGRITIDGVPLSRLRRENVHDLFCMVLQDTWLFEGTIRENIVYSKKGVSDGEVKAACKAVGLHHFIRTLPHGYDTVLGDSANISAGQKQLLTIARAMIENAPLLILDEATSSVDTRTELLVQKAMDRLMKGRTTFVIAHRLSTIKNADVILVMRDGDIVESGRHGELLEKGGFYAGLYNSQFEDAS